MNLESQVVSLELAKRLKELGVKYNNLFIWGRYGKKNDSDRDWCLDHQSNASWMEEWYSAYTSSELLELLPKQIKWHFYTQIPSSNEDWVIYYRDAFGTLKNKDEKVEVCAISECDARAKMLIFLLEKGIIKNET